MEANPYDRSGHQPEATRPAAEKGPAGMDAFSADRQSWIMFVVRNNKFAINIEQMKEIRVWTGASELPNVPGHVRGVFNLRGQIVPVFDVCTRFGMGRCETDEGAVVLVVETGEKVFGLLVDRVLDIVEYDATRILKIPEVVASETTRFLSGILQLGDDLIAAVNVGEFMNEFQIH